MTALVRYSLRALTIRDTAVASTLEGLNTVLLSAADGEPELFCTAIFGVFEPTDGGVIVQLGSGGHPYPLLRRASGEVEEVNLGGLLLGAMPDIDVAVAKATLTAGDLLVLFTDGVIEARDRDGMMFGVEGLTRVVAVGAASAQAMVDAIEAAVLDHVGGQLDDDVALVVLRLDPASTRRPD